MFYEANEMQQKLVTFFVQILQQNNKLLERVAIFDGDLFYDHDNCILVFKLSGLHTFLRNEINLDYTEFRKLIYKSTINEELQKLGGLIEIHQSIGNVDENMYRLVRLNQQ